MDRPVILGAAAFLLTSLGAAPVATPAPPMRFAQLIVRRQIIIRSVRVAPLPRRVMPDANIDWKEGKGPKCVAARSIAGASLLGQSSVDLLLRGGGRVRAKLGSSCPALDYYYGFYITPGPDGFVCSDRDVIRSRAGGECEIDTFKTLRPVAKD